MRARDQVVREEVRSDATRAVLDSGEPLIAPDLMVPQACNAAISSSTASTGHLLKEYYKDLYSKQPRYTREPNIVYL